MVRASAADEMSANRRSPASVPPRPASSSSSTVEKVFDDAQYTGQIVLAGRKLKQYPRSAAKYDLVDTTLVDLSRNRFGDVPNQVCDYHSLEQLICYNNVIKTLPCAITQLQSLVHLNLSRNLIAVLPPFICRLEQLQVLQVDNNRLVSLPEEIGSLKNLMELDVTCNQITHLPTQVGDLQYLRSLIVRRNLLVELPLSLCRLKLRFLDISCNRIAHIPCELHRMVSLEELRLENNPLLSPPAHACTKGLVHIRKLLCQEALKDERRQGIIQNNNNIRSNIPNVERVNSQSTLNCDEATNQSENGNFERPRGGMLDSGYGTANSSFRKLVIADAEKLQRQKLDDKLRRHQAEKLELEEVEIDERRRGVFSMPDGTQPSDQSPRENGKFVEPKHDLETQSFKEVQAVATPVVIPLQYLVSTNAEYNSNGNCSASEVWATTRINGCNSAILQEPRVISPQCSRSIPIPVHHITSESPSSDNGLASQPMETEFRRRHEAVVAQHRREAKNVLHRLDEEKMRLRRFFDDFDQFRHSNPFARLDDAPNGIESFPKAFNDNLSNSNSKRPALPFACQKALDAMSADLNSQDPVFTIRRNLHHAREEREQMKDLRKVIESFLKIRLPEDLPYALRDGVVLCHLANHIQPRSVPTIHVPSPAVPNLSTTKCRKNVDNFLFACRQMGIDQGNICTSVDILEERGIVDVAMTVKEMCRRAFSSQQSEI